ncbi:MAG: penicillin-binding transpeptidase domain-containing protein [Clostridiales bacterium]|nr:penicillin-binding transpeptidase domain-containing protein [Clostridiales bacterium]
MEIARRKRKVRISAAKQKLLVLIVLFSAMFAVLIGRLYWASIVKGEEFSEGALRQWRMNTSLRAQRGEIQDRDGTVLATSYTTYQVCVNPRAIKPDDRERVAVILADTLGLDYDFVLERVKRVERQQIKIKDQVEKTEINSLAAKQLGSGVSYYSDVKRTYREGNHFSQLLGFTNIDGDGQTGLELTYNSYLAGINGRQIAETDRDNRPIPGGMQDFVEPVPGDNVILTADTGLQSMLESTLEMCAIVNRAQTVQGLLMNPMTGEIYAMGCYPSYDPNFPPRTDAKLLLEMAKNRMVTDTYEPGSTFKVVTLAAALDLNAITTASSFDCGGALRVSGQPIRCWKRAGGHGHQSLEKAVQNSCNCAFMSMALKMGRDAFYEYIYAFGYDTATEVGLTGETSGTVTHRKYIRDTDLARIGFGQSISNTGMQLAMAVSAAINGGELLKPYIVSEIVSQTGEVVLKNERTVIRRVIKPETSVLMRGILQSVVEEGSGRNAQVPGYTVGGKTGTAQKYEEDGSVSSTRLIASFVGFAPVSDPQFLCLIIVDEPEVPVVFGSTVAAPFVQIMLANALSYTGVPPDSETARVTVPDLTGMTVDEAKAELQKLRLTALFSENEATAMVSRQAPPAGTVVVRDSAVILYTSWTTFLPEGEEQRMVRMPNIIDKTRLQALDLLAEVGLVMDYDRARSAGKVSSAEYEAGTMVPYGTSVRVEFRFES